MMKFFKIITILILFFFQVSCSQEIKEKIEYSKDMRIDSMLFNHFPREICTETYWLDTNTNEERNNIAIFLKYKNCLQNVDSLFNNFEKQSIKKYNFKENCLLIVNSSETMESLVMSDKVKDSLDFDSMECNYSEKIPIPNFKIYFENSSDDYDVFVFEAKKGLYSKFYKFDYNKLMPSYWNHGYSKGVAFSKTSNEIIYWGCMW